MPDSIAKRFKQYDILSLIGEGGMGQVFLAHDPKLGRKVAVKFLPEHLNRDPRSRERFLREARAAAGLDHPFICKIFEAGEFQGRAYIVMEFVEGRNLKETLAGRALPVREALQVVAEVAEALAEAHAKGFVHRDLKPANLICTPQGHVKVMDFGLAKHVRQVGGMETLTRTTDVTREGTIVGTLAYMSPEQARGEEVDARSDIFSLGVVLSEVLSGQNPFHRPSTAEVLSAVLRDQPELPRIKPKALNPAVGHILQKALAKDPAKRYAKIDEMAADLRRVQAELASSGGWLVRKWPFLAAGAAVLVAAFFGLGRLVGGRGPAKPAAAPAPIRVLVADFENRAGDPVFDGALEQTFALGLEEAPFIDLFRRADARRRAGQLDPTASGRLDERLAQLVCRSEGIPVLIEGSIEKQGDGYRLHVRAFDPLAARTLTELERTIKRKTQAVEEAMGLGLRMSSRLGGVPEETERAMSRETFTTSSLEAMQAYDKAQDMARAGRSKDAIAEYERAVQEDPNFGRAYAGLAVIYYNSGDQKKAEEYQGQALSLIDRMTEREKLRTRSNWYLMTKNYPKAIEECGNLVKLFPADSAGVSNLAMAHYFARDMERAVEFGKRRVELNPQGVVARANLAWYEIASGGFEQAETEARQAIAGQAGYEKAYLPAALSFVARGNLEQARSTYLQLEGVSRRGASFAAYGQADLALYEGRTAEAAKILDRAIAADLEKEGAPDLAAQKMALLAQVELARGRKASAIAAGTRACATSQKPEILFLAGEAFLLAGQPERARALAADLARRFEPEPQAYARLIEAEILRETGQLQDALRTLRDAQRTLDTWLGRFALGRAYLDAGAFTEAYSEFETCARRRGEALVAFLDDYPSARYLPLIPYYLGRAQEGLKSPAAKESYKSFLAIKERSEADPLVEDARRRLAKL